jgi:hypothetical protein
VQGATAECSGVPRRTPEADREYGVNRDGSP